MSEIEQKDAKDTKTGNQPRSTDGRFGSSNSPQGQRTDTNGINQDQFNQLMEQNAKLLESNQALNKRLTDQENEKTLTKLQTDINGKLSELEKLHPALALQHKDNKDLKDLQTAIDTAKQFQSGFPEYQTELDKNAPAEKQQWRPPHNPSKSK